MCLYLREIHSIHSILWLWTSVTTPYIVMHIWEHIGILYLACMLPTMFGLPVVECGFVVPEGELICTLTFNLHTHYYHLVILQDGTGKSLCQEQLQDEQRELKQSVISHGAVWYMKRQCYIMDYVLIFKSTLCSWWVHDHYHH